MLDIYEINKISSATDNIFANKFAEISAACMDKYLFHLIESSKVGARMILKQVK